MSARLCHVCGRPQVLDVEHPEDAHLEVALANHIYFAACFSCWFKWPREHRRSSSTFSDVVLAELGDVSLDDLVAVLRETA